MAKFANSVCFLPAAGGTADFTVSSAVTGFMTPALAGMPTGTYKYRAESANLSQWEIGEGTYTSGTGILTRTTVLYNSSGTGTASGQSGAGSKINFSAAPNVGIVQLTEDTLGIDQSNSWSAAQKLQARDNIGAGVFQTTTFTASGTFTTPADSTTSTIYRYKMVGAGGGGGGSGALPSSAGGGGAGAYAEGTFTGVAASTGITITIGAGGTGGITGGGNGGNGGDTIIGSPVSITCGGGVGALGSNTALASPGPGGTVTGTPNILSINGMTGGYGVAGSGGSSGGAGDGADSLLGVGGIGGKAGYSGSYLVLPKGYGAGGGGGFASGVGSVGAAGIVIIERLTP